MMTKTNGGAPMEASSAGKAAELAAKQAAEQENVAAPAAQEGGA